MSAALREPLIEILQHFKQLLADTTFDDRQRATLETAQRCALEFMNRLEPTSALPVQDEHRERRKLALGIFGGAEMLIRSGVLSPDQTVLVTRVHELARVIRSAIENV